MKEQNRAELGRWGESVAAGHLVATGHAIVARNWRHRRSEIDLIATCGPETVFVEVKVRGSDEWESTETVVRPDQRRRLIRAANAFLKTRAQLPGRARFDVIHIVLHDGGWKLEHVADAFLPLLG